MPWFLDLGLSRGYRPIELSTVLVLELGEAAEAPAPAALQVRRAGRAIAPGSTPPSPMTWR